MAGVQSGSNTAKVSAMLTYINTSYSKVSLEPLT